MSKPAEARDKARIPMQNRILVLNREPLCICIFHIGIIAQKVTGRLTAKFGGHLVPELGAARQSEAENYSALEPVD
jgi:hypothetical protein